jgi:hypothetical protein
LIKKENPRSLELQGFQQNNMRAEDGALHAGGMR